MKIATIPRPIRLPVAPALSCEVCGEALVQALRYGPTPEPITVLWCRDGCDTEFPPLLTVRSAPSADRVLLVCAHCRAEVYVRPFEALIRRFCSQPCWRAYQRRRAVS